MPAFELTSVGVAEASSRACDERGRLLDFCAFEALEVFEVSSLSALPAVFLVLVSGFSGRGHSTCCDRSRRSEGTHSSRRLLNSS